MFVQAATKRALLLGGGLAASLCAVPAAAEEAIGEDAAVETAADNIVPASTPKCDANGTCRFQITPAQMMAKAEALIHAKQYDRALPLVEALGQVPDLKMQQQFLAGYIAVETGDLKKAIKTFRSILDENPGQTRVRLELARTYLMSGKEASADYHFRLAQNDDNLPDEISRTIRNTRSILRDQRVWRFSFDFGFAPDTNINGATNAETIDVNFGAIFPVLGDAQGELELDEDARQKSGIGQIAGFSGGVRLKASNKLAFLFDADSKIINYQGKAADDIVGQIAVGPELRIARYASVSVQAVGQQRWFGGKLATREYGARVGFQAALSQGQRVGIELDGRRTDSKLSDSFSGWQLGANTTYEHLIGKSLIASASLFARRDLLNSDAFSSINYGVNLGIGGELPFGLNAGISGSISRSTFDEAIELYSTEKRKDWRSFGRAYIGSRQVKFLGFSPSVDYNYSRVDSNYELYQMNRHRVNFKLAKFF
ncbi:MAG: surface lipoprotein assembly modifier [Parasphingorhabdus sp.]|uniref:surface lipoprotein assembly modifier n=1 Tax=Parasphingorhabdus sp. TaxID=2709688 RepID=UPI0032988B44